MAATDKFPLASFVANSAKKLPTQIPRRAGR